ncbi:precorrin 3B synthase CobZ [Fonsecaea erecta]|uniref:Precorrin 3B synthase CobZ n=1 Tax=Fonsecaea erecta TaxID=1367422 RepID=A0A178ZEN9_9EURO|nr:precorrin 3B synthase CobZ [Fonsecaea erecta]OAP57946.1 precorrin 3B synthase CobZ [Fonsecaea erecta]
MDDTTYCTMGPYTDEMFYNDLSKTSHRRLDKGIAEVLIKEGWETTEWMKSKGHKWKLMIKKSHDVENLASRGEVINISSGAWRWAAVPAHNHIAAGDTVHGVKICTAMASQTSMGRWCSPAVAFHPIQPCAASTSEKAGNLIFVRGAKYNMGTMLNRAIVAGGRPVGHWDAAHASPQDANGPLTGDINVSMHMPRYAYPYGITINKGERFFDEGKDDFDKTYAKTGKKIGDKPGARAFQIFDQQNIHLLPKRYQTATPIYADTIQELAERMGVNAAGLLKTVETFNAACSGDATKFNPTRLDGLRTSPEAKLPFPKTNWTTRDRQGPFCSLRRGMWHHLHIWRHRHKYGGPCTE